MGLKEVIIDALTELIDTLFEPLEAVVEEYSDDVLNFVVGTDAPNAVFSRPTNGVWPNLYDYYWETIFPLALTLWALSIGLVIFLESTSNLFGGYQRAKLKRRAFSGLLGVLSWWWMAAFSMQFVDSLTGYILPNLSDITLFHSASFTAMGVLGYAMSMAVSNSLLVSIAVIYLARRLAIYMFVLLMPVLIVMWIPCLGPFAGVARLMKRLAGFYVPFLFMTLPTAVLFQLGHLLGNDFGLSVSGFTAWLVALVIPVLALVAPFILFWQAGAMFLASERISRQVSVKQARQRMGKTRAAGSATVHGGRNLSRGLRGESAVRRDGQTVFGSGESRAHAAGSRLRGGARHFSSAVSTGGGDQGGGGGRTFDRGAERTSRNESFDALRPLPRTDSRIPELPDPTSDTERDSE
ncbi:hypothetical protein [Haloarchaeobius sp. HRN-SO-5]|uniref:hypothetical protein n=1 Tax=Haloarchaeobius sp. HRN-SO-5 TaxID=3446118 RepID=UPI003EBA246A